MVFDGLSKAQILYQIKPRTLNNNNFLIINNKLHNSQQLTYTCGFIRFIHCVESSLHGVDEVLLQYISVIMPGNIRHGRFSKN